MPNTAQPATPARPTRAHPARALLASAALSLATLGLGLANAHAAPAPTAMQTAPAPATAPANTAALRVLVAHPVLHGLAQQLVQSTDIELIAAAPARLPSNRQPAYLAGRGLDALLAQAPNAQAVLGLRSVWADDQLYPLARRANIHIVEIDAANPIEGDLPGITLTRGADAPSVLIRQPWQNSANLARMATISADALARLAPRHAAQLQANANTIVQTLQRAEATTSQALATAPELSVLILSPRVQVLASTLELEPVPWSAPQNDAELAAALTQAIARHRPRAILSHTAPEAEVAQAIAAEGVPLIILSESAPDPVAALAQAMQAIAQAMSTPPNKP